MTVMQIKNTLLRRTVVVLLYPWLFIGSIVLGAFHGAVVDFVRQLDASAKRAWDGK